MDQAIVISKKLHIRTRMRQLIAHIEGLDCTVSVNALHDAETLFESKRWFRFVFVGSEFSPHECAAFIENARRSESDTQKCIFILVFTEGEQSAEGVANRLVAGFHGFLCEPISLGAFLELAELAERVSQQRTIFRLKAATGILMSDLKDEPESSASANLLVQSLDNCASYNARTKESLTVALCRIANQRGVERLRSLTALKEKFRNASGAVGGYVRRLLPRSSTRQ